MKGALVGLAMSLAAANRYAPPRAQWLAGADGSSAVEEKAPTPVSEPEAACRSGDAASCLRLGTLYQEGRGVRKDERRAADLYDKACNAGAPVGCYKLGTLYREGVGVSLDEGRAASLFDKACTGGEPNGCIGLGLLYEDGLGVEQDGSRAAALYEKACAGGANMGCANLGVLYEVGFGVARNEARAIAMFKKACGGGIASACDSLARLAPADRPTSSPNPASTTSSTGTASSGAPLGGPAVWDVQLGLRGEADLLNPAFIGALSGELSRGAFSGVLTVIFRLPPAFRAEGRFHPFKWGPVQPYAGLGTSLFLTADTPVVAGRAVLGVDASLSPIHVFSDAAFEHSFNAPAEYSADTLLLSLGVGWRF